MSKGFLDILLTGIGYYSVFVLLCTGTILWLRFKSVPTLLASSGFALAILGILGAVLSLLIEGPTIKDIAGTPDVSWNQAGWYLACRYITILGLLCGSIGLYWHVKKTPMK
ncbi:MAG: hypothetical protein WCC11_10410 [Gammaproteobacteria bacterium]